MKTIMNDKYYDVTELSNMFGLSKNTIRNYFNNGKIVAIKIGKSWFAKESDINIFLDQTPSNKISLTTNDIDIATTNNINN